MMLHVSDIPMGLQAITDAEFTWGFTAADVSWLSEVIQAVQEALAIF